MKDKIISNFNKNKKMIKTSFALTSGRVFNMFVSFVLLLIQSRFIGPETTGKVAYFAIPLGYLWILTLGIPSALARELPYYLAKGEREKALVYAQTTQSFSIMMGLLCSLWFGILAISSFFRGDYFYAMGWAFQVISAFFAIYNSYILTLFRTTEEFIKVAKASALSAVTRIVAFPLIFINPYVGLFMKPISSDIATNTYLYLKRPLKFKFGFNIRVFLDLLKFGMPLIMIGYIEANLWTSAQATMIVRMGDTTQLGLYNFIKQIMLLLLIIPNVVSEVLRPKFATVYGQTNGSLKKALKASIKPLSITFTFSLIAVFLSWLFIGDIIHWLLPKYVDAIPALEIALLLVPVMTVATIKYMFVVIKSMKYNAISTIPGFLIGLGLLYLILSNDISFRYIYMPYIIGQLVNFLISACILFFQVRKEV